MAEVETQVLEAVQDWAVAFNEGNAAAVAALYAPDAVLWGTVSQAPTSTAKGIRQYFDQVCTGDVPLKVSLGDVLVRVQAETAVSCGAYTFTIDMHGMHRTLPARFTFTYRRSAAGWLVVTHHSSLMPPEMPAGLTGLRQD
ncbi:MAG: SgcJ/EcaC family oxidoreductase [Comamonadaceae bacterium]|nr:MAG: SgcJ/EcaC family oxidoreductase [Comamonadaceae bacterium]